VSHSRTVHTVAALALFVGVGTTGCTEPAAKPKPLPSPSSSSVAESPTASATPTPPSIPAEARGLGDDAAKAFAKHYVALINYSSRTGRTGELTAMSGSRCQSCQTIAGSIRDVYSAGGRIESRGWRLHALSVVPEQPIRRPILELGVIESPERVRRTANGPVKHFKGGRQPMTMYLRRAGGAWSVDRLDLVPS
jgi:hypothetical protein